MPQKKKHPKIRVNGKWVEAGEHGPEKLGINPTPKSFTEKRGYEIKNTLHIDPTLKPIVVETKGGSKEEQEDNPLNRMKEKSGVYLTGLESGTSLPKGFKTADKLTEKDDLEFDNGRLREMLVSWLDRVVVDGVVYQVMVDPLNRAVVITREK